MRVDSMNLIHATCEHIPQLAHLDCHIAEAELCNLISYERILVAEDKGKICGWLRWNLFWDNTPFMNMLYLLEPYRGKGFGRNLVTHWEEEMHRLGYKTVMTSTASDEYAQHFYQKMGYQAIGGFAPFGEPYELILMKKLTL